MSEANGDNTRKGFARVNILAPITFDMPHDTPPRNEPGAFGTIIHHVLPSFDMTDGTFRPALGLYVQSRESAPAAEFGFDLCRLLAAIDELERGLGGTGVRPEAPGAEAAPIEGRLRVTLRLNSAEGALDRVNHLIRAINKEPMKVNGDSSCPSIASCSAGLARES